MTTDELRTKHKKLSGSWGNDFYIVREMLGELVNIKQTLDEILDLMKTPIDRPIRLRLREAKEGIQPEKTT